mmetsp:Transcript_68802/g.161865  ORF Transcript_68802/g.161865 Transcript_68802/m.161865 type:complete len:463 (+) Transcript_68802:987-2375(+)
MPCSKPPTGTTPRLRDSEHASNAQTHPWLRSRHRPRKPRPALHAEQDLQRQLDRLRRCAQHPGLAGGPGAARHAAGAEPRRRGARHPLRPGRWRQGGAAVDLRPQELLLPRPTQGLPDQPVRDPGGAGRQGGVLRRRPEACGQPDPRPPGRRRRQEPARGLPRPERHRPEPGRHAAAGDRVRARHALGPGSGRVRQDPACAGDVAGHLRRQYAGGLVPLRRERVGAQARRALWHAPRDQEPQQLPLPRRRGELRGQLADRRDRGWPQDPAGHGALQPGHRRDPRDAQQGRLGRLPLLPRPRPAAAGDRAGMGGAGQGRDARATVGDGGTLRRGGRPARIRRDDDDAEPGHGALLRGRQGRGRDAEAGRQLGHGRDQQAAQCLGRRDRHGAGRAGTAGDADRPHRRRHDLEQRRQAGVRGAVERRVSGCRCRDRRQGLEAGQRYRRHRGHPRRGAGRESKVGG